MPTLRTLAIPAAIFAAILLLDAGPVRAQAPDPQAPQTGQPAGVPGHKQPTRAAIEQALQERGLKKPPPQEQARPAPPGAPMKDREVDTLADQILKLSDTQPIPQPAKR